MFVIYKCIVSINLLDIITCTIKEGFIIIIIII